MFPYAMRPLKEVRSRTRVLVLPSIIALLVFLALPSSATLAQSSVSTGQRVQHAPSQAQTTHVALAGGIGAISYNNNLYDFVIGSDGHVWADIWNGYNWHWEDRGAPSVGIGGGVGVGSWNNNLYVFIIGGNGHLWVDTWNRSTWQWYDQGVPPGGVTVASGAGVVSSGIDLFVFFVGSNGHLWVDLWNSSTWQWSDQGTPPNGTLIAGVAATISGNHLYVFAQVVSESVWVDIWNGSNWQWTDLASPPAPGYSSGNVEVCDRGGAVSYNSSIDVFTGDCAGFAHFWVDQWNGSTWQWYDQGTPGHGIIDGSGALSVSVYLYVFFVATDYHLWVDYWNGSTWGWYDQGQPV